MIAQYWNTTEAEQRAVHPADECAPPGATHVVRAIDVDADAPTVFRWLCQLKVAPYSYDLVDNLGRRSPRSLTPRADDLAIGQRFLVGPISAFTPGEFIAATLPPWGRKIFGTYAMSYQVTPGRTMRSRIVVCLSVDARGVVGRTRAAVMAAGDLVMMRKQLRVLKQCAERSGQDS